MNIAIVSSKAFLGQVEDDLLVRDALKALGINARCAAWDDEREDWSQFDVAVLRSAWGYQHSLTAFEAWIDKLRARLINLPEMIRGNIYKNIQFAHLSKAGLPMIPTVMLSAYRAKNTFAPEPTLQACIKRHFPDQKGAFVLKPIVSASGHDTVLFDFDDAAQRHGAVCVKEAEDHFHQLLNRRETVGVILQPFVPQIDQGEYALIFFGGHFSHAVLRFPAVFRKDRTAHFVVPSAHVLSLGERALLCLPESPAYARVDVVDTDHGPLLMELELCEPHLFFNSIGDANQRNAALHAFAQAILR